MTMTPRRHVLLAWYDRHRRTLPWRAPAGERTPPYLVWLSEIMLQQTTVATVGDYFHRFVKRWPTVEALAAAPLDEVLSAWAGLGYYARARNLHACARAVVERSTAGTFPEDEAGLLALPGIGRYTAAAIRAIAFDQPASAVDGNVERVIARLYAIETPLPDAKTEIAARAAELVPDAARRRLRPGDDGSRRHGLHAAQPALRDLPADAGLPGAQARASPRSCRAARPRPTSRRAAASPSCCCARTARCCCASVRPRACWAAWTRCRRAPGARASCRSPRRSRRRRCRPTGRCWTGGVRHTFTHFHLELAVARAIATTAGLAKLAPGTAWVTVDQMTERALPTVMRKVIAHAVKA